MHFNSFEKCCYVLIALKEKGKGVFYCKVEIILVEFLLLSTYYNIVRNTVYVVLANIWI